MVIDDPPPALEIAGNAPEGLDGVEQSVARGVSLNDPRSSKDLFLDGLDDSYWSIGPLIGALRARGADTPSFFGGLHVQYRPVDVLAIDISGSIHRSSFAHRALRAYQYPLQLNALVFPFPQWEVQPYAQAGGGFYYTELTYMPPLSSLYADTHKAPVGGQGGLGVEIKHNSACLSLEADYVLVPMNADGVKAHSFDYWQVVLTINICF